MAMARHSGEAREGQERSCALTRRPRSPDDLLRFVAAPDGTLVPDIRRKLPGRGVWLSLGAATLAEAVRRKVFERALKTKVAVPDGLADQVAVLLAADARQALAMANKAGLVATGFAKVEAAVGSGRIAAVIAASDGAEDGRRKIGQALRRAAAEREADGGRTHGVPVVDAFTSSELELALGRQHVIHAALAPGPATEAFLARWRRLVRYLTDDAGDVPSADPVDSEASGELKSEPAGPIAG
jgi:predicted RNA-binding protein YlxR (DUF448 family)